MKTSTILIATALLAAGIYAGDSNSPEPDADAGFARLKTLAGEWEAKTAEGTARMSYELTGAGTTLVERETGEKMPEMTTMYHLNGSRLMLTHYCMAGNQPRMQARSFDAKTGELRFQYLDATNLADANAGHMHNMTIRITDHDHLVTEWEFYENGKKKFTETTEFKRIR